MPKPESKPAGTIWQPLTGLPEGAENWVVPSYDERLRIWLDQHQRLIDKNHDRTRLEIWLRERKRAFTIETGQIENLYTLQRGVTEQLITEGFYGVSASHTMENIDDVTIKGLLQDQEAALEMVFDDIKNNKPLTHYTLKSWHQLLTRHQLTVSGFRIIEGTRQRVALPFTRKGQYKIRPNNPRRADGTIHEYCPPEHVQAEMDHLLALYQEIRSQAVPTHVEAGWLHHRFVGTHPFQDGNGRVSRLLVAYVYLQRGEPTPIINANEKAEYMEALEIADRGNLKPFCDYLADKASQQLRSLITTAEQILEGNTCYTHANGGITRNGTYYPPEK